MTGGDVKEGKEVKERPALPVAGYEPPRWAGKAAPGLHLDVLKVLVLTVTISKEIIFWQQFCLNILIFQEGKLIQKLMIDEKNYYLFGRNHQTCDFVVDHGSCSRLVLGYRIYIIDYR